MGDGERSHSTTRNCQLLLCGRGKGGGGGSQCIVGCIRLSLHSIDCLSMCIQLIWCATPPPPNVQFRLYTTIRLHNIKNDHKTFLKSVKIKQTHFLRPSGRTQTHSSEPGTIRERFGLQLGVRNIGKRGRKELFAAE